MTDKSLCNSCTNIGCEFQSGIVRTKCAFYMPPQLEPDNCGNYVVQDSTTKNDCAEQNGCISCSLDDGDDCCRKLYEESMQDSTTKNDIRDNRVKNELNRVKDELEPTTKNNLGVDCIDRVELLKAMDTYDKFGNDSNERLIFLSTPALQDRYVPYVHYDEMVNCVKSMPSVTPQESILDRIRTEILEYIDDLDIAYEICGIFDKYNKK